MKIPHAPTTTMAAVLGLLLVASGLPTNAASPTDGFSTGPGEGPQSPPEIAALDSGRAPPCPVDRKDGSRSFVPQDRFVVRYMATPGSIRPPARSGEGQDSPFQGFFGIGQKKWLTNLSIMAALAQGPLQISAVAQRVNISRQHAHRVLQELMSQGFVEEVPEGTPSTYALTKTTLEFRQEVKVPPGQVLLDLKIEIGLQKSPIEDK